jgi:hypothetical protein
MHRAHIATQTLFSHIVVWRERGGHGEKTNLRADVQSGHERHEKTCRCNGQASEVRRAQVVERFSMHPLAVVAGGMPKIAVRKGH